MKRIVNAFFLIVAAILAQPASGAGLPVAADTITRSDTVVTREIVQRTEIITRKEIVIHKDTVYTTSGATPKVVPAVTDVERPVDVILNYSVPEAAECSLPVEKTVLPDTVYVYRDRPDTVVIYRDRPDTVDHSERVTFRGDTIPMVLRDRNFGRFNRGLFNYLFIPKGIWQIGITASYGEFSTEDLEVLDLISDVDVSGHMFSVRPYFSYFIGSNMSVGMRLGYSTGRGKVGSFNVDIDDDMNFNLKDISYRSESYTAALTFNQYFGITRRGRFGIFNEVELAFSSGNSDFVRPYNSELKTTHTTTMQAALNFSPGLCVFIMDQVSFNVSFGVFGFSLKNEKQTVDGEDMGNRFTSGANFRFNIFNINFGVAVNL